MLNLRRRLNYSKYKALLWLQVFRSFKSLSFKSQVNLLLSFLIDIMESLITEPRNPRTLFSGVYLIKPFRLIVCVRGGTEDLYNLLPRREESVHDIVVSILRLGDVFVDVGANVGYYTLLASRFR